MVSICQLDWKLLGKTSKHFSKTWLICIKSLKWEYNPNNLLTSRTDDLLLCKKKLITSNPFNSSKRFSDLKKNTHTHTHTHTHYSATRKGGILAFLTTRMDFEGIMLNEISLKRPWCWERLRQEEKGTTEDEMVWWHHQLNGHEFGWTPGVGDGQGGLACCGSWGRKESDTTEQLNWTELNTEKDKSI